MKPSSYVEISEPGLPVTEKTDTILFTRLEEWILSQYGQDEDDLVLLWKQEIKRLIEWENDAVQRCVIMIGTDQSKGIVPLEKEQRFTRDVLGWCHQHTASKADRVTRIWYGLAEELKTKEELR
nr:bifunctional adenosylcobinamide kinase/adenosylcobinamide-phosphate guanylyltransferase [Jeotgalibacillus terrae]